MKNQSSVGLEAVRELDRITDKVNFVTAARRAGVASKVVTHTAPLAERALAKEIPMSRWNEWHKIVNEIKCTGAFHGKYFKFRPRGSRIMVDRHGRRRVNYYDTPLKNAVTFSVYVYDSH